MSSFSLCFLKLFRNKSHVTSKVISLTLINYDILWHCTFLKREEQHSSLYWYIIMDYRTFIQNIGCIIYSAVTSNDQNNTLNIAVFAIKVVLKKFKRSLFWKLVGNKSSQRIFNTCKNFVAHLQNQISHFTCSRSVQVFQD